MNTAYAIHAAWHKAADQHVHLRVVELPGLRVIELRDWNESTRKYGRGMWFAESPATQDLLARATHTAAHAPAGSIPTPAARVLAAIEQAPGSEVHLRVIEVDGIPALELREHSRGTDLRGYWIPYNAIAEQILLSALTHEQTRSAA